MFSPYRCFTLAFLLGSTRQALLTFLRLRGDIGETLAEERWNVLACGVILLVEVNWALSRWAGNGWQVGGRGGGFDFGEEGAEVVLVTGGQSAPRSHGFPACLAHMEGLS